MAAVLELEGNFGSRKSVFKDPIFTHTGLCECAVSPCVPWSPGCLTWATVTQWNATGRYNSEVAEIGWRS